MTDDVIYQTEALIAEDIGAYLETHQHKTMLRFITCGSVDDGKSTLIGRLLYDSKMIFEDQLAALETDSRRVGTQGQEIDFALLVDGLAAEREQGITIDVAYRFFNTDKRKFIVADCPGHEQYTRNMVTGASTADLAVILIDARKGVLVQTRRHSYLCHLLGIRNLVLAVNKMDLIGYDQARYDEIVADYTAFAKSIGIESFTAMPISGFKGDNITQASDNTPWYTGPDLIAHLETVEVNSAVDAAKPFRMPVQWVNRPNLDFRGFSGLIATGAVKPGDAIRVLPSGKTTTVSRVVTQGGNLDEAVAGQSVTVCFADEIDCSRGDVIAAADTPPEAADQFEATVVWLADEALIPGRAYWLKLATQTVSATVQAPKYVVNVNNVGGPGEHLAAKTLELNAIGVAELATDKPIVFEAYADNRTLGGFVLVDKLTNATVAAGMLHFSLRRAQNVHWQATDIGREAHAGLKNQTPRVLWFTGLSGSGKSSLASSPTSPSPADAGAPSIRRSGSSETRLWPPRQSRSTASSSMRAAWVAMAPNMRRCWRCPWTDAPCFPVAPAYCGTVPPCSRHVFAKPGAAGELRSRAPFAASQIVSVDLSRIPSGPYIRPTGLMDVPARPAKVV